MSDIGDMIEQGSAGPEWQQAPACAECVRLRVENARLQKALDETDEEIEDVLRELVTT